MERRRQVISAWRCGGVNDKSHYRAWRCSGVTGGGARRERWVRCRGSGREAVC